MLYSDLSCDHWNIDSIKIKHRFSYLCHIFNVKLRRLPDEENLCKLNVSKRGLFFCCERTHDVRERAHEAGMRKGLFALIDKYWTELT